MNTYMKLIVGGPIQKNTGIMISANVSIPIEHRSCKKKKHSWVWQRLWDWCIPKIMHMDKRSCWWSISYMQREIEDTTENTSINFNDKTSYWILWVVLLAIVCLLLLLVIAVGFYMKRVLKVPSLLSYCHILLGYDRISVFVGVDIVLHKKWSFPLRNSLVNVNKSAFCCGFGYI